MSCLVARHHYLNNVAYALAVRIAGDEGEQQEALALIKAQLGNT
jgi:hypothetical protein